MNVSADQFLLSCSGLKRRVGSTPILDVDRLDLVAGQTYLLSGPNGAGKTTLLRALAGLEPVQCEKMRFRDQAINPCRYPRRLRRQIAFVHHHPLLFSTSIAKNIAYGLHGAAIARREVSRRTEAAIDWAGVRSLLDRSPQALSAGEKQRVALARAHALEPLLYLLDEPTANLDGSGRELVLKLIDAISREGRTLLIACHDRELLNLSGVRHLRMSAGRLESAS